MTKLEIKMLYFKTFDKLKNYILFMPAISFISPNYFKYPRTRGIAGQYCTLTNQIKINKNHWIHTNKERFLDTIIHELVHAHMHQLGLKCHHNVYFIQMYQRFSEIVNDTEQLMLVQEHVSRYTNNDKNEIKESA